MYPFEALEKGAMRRWLLWDREWIRRQLYNLRDLGVLSKVSEIDAMRQFTLRFGQREALRRYFEHPDREALALREGSTTEATEKTEGAS
jgi:DNA repair protein RadC